MVTHLLRRGRKASWFIVALLTSSCADLQDIPLGVCGNNVVDEGEDCEGPGTETQPCGQPGAAHECRFVWVNEKDCAEGSVPSPDNRCRKPSGNFELAPTSFDLPGRNLVTVDLEGDGSFEVASLVEQEFGLPGLALNNVSPAGAFSLGEPLPSVGYVGLGDLSEDGRPDVALSIRFGFEGGGLTVLVGRDGVLDLKLFPEPTIAQDLRFITLAPWLFPSDTAGTDFDLEVLARLTKDPGKVRMCPVDFGCTEEKTLSLLNFSFENVVVVHDEISQLIGTKDLSGFLYLPRESTGTAFSGEVDASKAPTLTFAEVAGEKVTPLSGPALVDLNGDGLNDVAAIGVTETNAVAGLYVLLGETARAGETFPRWETNQNLPNPDRLTLWLNDEDTPANSVLQSSRFIAAQINSDGLPDFVLDRQILISKRELMAGDQLREAFRVVDLDPEATIADGEFAGFVPPLAVGDINGDGLDDIVRSNGFETVLVSYGGNLLPLTEVELTAERVITALAISDFDGDGAGDILAAGPELNETAKDPAEDCARDELLIAYGSKVGLPEVPASIGVIQPVTQLVSGRFWAGKDGFGDFAVASRCEASQKIENVVLNGNAFRVEGKPKQLELLINDKPVPLLPQHVFLGDVVSLCVPDAECAVAPKADNHNDLIVLGELGEYGALGRAAVVYPSTGDAEIAFDKASYFLVPRNESAWDDLAVESSSGLVIVGMAEAETNADFTYDKIIGRVLAHDLESGLSTEIALPPLDLAGLSLQRPFAHIVGFRQKPVGPPTGYIFVYGGEVQDELGQSGGAGTEGSEFGTRATVLSHSVLLLREGSKFTTEDLGNDVANVVVADTFNDGTDAVYLVYSNGFVGQLGGETPVSFSADLQATTQATSGDFNADGLIDLLVSDGTSGKLLYQLPVNP